MNMTKKKTALLALALIAVFAVGVGAGVFLTPKYISVTVGEAITVSPETVSIDMLEGETHTADFYIDNQANVPIPLTITVQLIPDNATYASYFTLNYTSPFTALAKTNHQLFNVTIQASTSTPIGTYIFELSFER